MRERGVSGEIITLSPSAAKTSASAAQAVGCDVAQIAKSIVLKGEQGLYIFILSGDKRVDLARASAIVGEKLSLAKPDEVLARLGYPVGGVPPFGHAEQVKTFVDKSVLRFEEVFASGGSEDTLLRIRVSELLRAVGGVVAEASR